MTLPKIRLTRRWPEQVEHRLRLRYEVTRNESDRPLERETLRAAMRQFDALCTTVSDVIDAEIIETSGATVRILGNYGAGFDHIDVQAARRAGIVVTNTPEVLTETTAELALLLMLMVSRRAGEGERELRAGSWTGWRPSHLPGQSLSGKLLGLVGFGRIAQTAARRARDALGMHIAYYSRTRAAPEIETALNAQHHGTLDALLAAADVLSLHCPGGAETYHLLDAARLARMKPSAILINTARGTIIDEPALAQALASRRLAGAGLDVFEDEPRVAPALLELENVVLLPHLGSATAETRIAMGMRVADNLDSFFSGRQPRDRVS